MSRVIAQHRNMTDKERRAAQPLPHLICDALLHAGLLLPADPAVHLCPPAGQNITPCCGYPPFELPYGDRMTTDISDVTCGISG